MCNGANRAGIRATARGLVNKADTTSGIDGAMPGGMPVQGSVVRAIAALVNFALASITGSLTTLTLGFYTPNLWINGSIIRVRYWPFDLIGADLQMATMPLPPPRSRRGARPAATVTAARPDWPPWPVARRARNRDGSARGSGGNLPAGAGGANARSGAARLGSDTERSWRRAETAWLTRTQPRAAGGGGGCLQFRHRGLCRLRIGSQYNCLSRQPGRGERTAGAATLGNLAAEA